MDVGASPVIAPALPEIVERGGLYAVASTRCPGVLLRAPLLMDSASTFVVERARAGSRTWEPVRSGNPARRVGNAVIAYDHEAGPGAWAYRVRVGSNVRSVLVDVPELAHCEAWLKHVERPSLSRRVRLMHPDEAAPQSLATFSELYAGGWAAQGGGLGPESGSWTIRTETREDFVDLSALLSARGTLLLQASPDHAMDDRYVVVTGAPRSRPGDTYGWRLRERVVSWRQMDRPWSEGARLRIPFASWGSLTQGARSYADVWRAYPTRWDMCLAAIGRRDLIGMID